MFAVRISIRTAAVATSLLAIGAGALYSQDSAKATLSGTLQESLVTKNLPSADEVLSKYEKFLGGKDALAKAQTRVVWSRRIVDTGAPSETVLYRRSKKPNFSIMGQYSLDGVFTTWTNGCDGQTGWDRDGENIKDANPNAAAGPICHQDLFFYGYSPLDLDYMKKSYRQVEVKSELRIVQPPVSIYGTLAGGKGKDLVPEGPRDAYLVLALPARDGDVGTWLYFDKETGALLRRQHDNKPVPGPPAANAIVTDYLQYRAVGDGTVASFQFVTHNRNGMTRGIHTKIEDNVSLDNNAFVKPKKATREDKGL